MMMMMDKGSVLSRSFIMLGIDSYLIFGGFYL